MVADLSVRAHRFVALSFDAGDTSFTNHYLKTLLNFIPNDMPERYRGNIAHRTLYNLRKIQNDILLKKFEDSIELSALFQSQNRWPLQMHPG